MKNVMYEKPVMAIARFSGEDVVTTSTPAGEKAVAGLTTSGSNLLGGKQALDTNSVISFNF